MSDYEKRQADPQAYSLGHAAYHRTGDPDTNPYPYESASWYEWKRGFEDAAAE